jgi:hypothetical protein
VTIGNVRYRHTADIATRIKGCGLKGPILLVALVARVFSTVVRPSAMWFAFAVVLVPEDYRLFLLPALSAYTFSPSVGRHCAQSADLMAKKSEREEASRRHRHQHSQHNYFPIIHASRF